MPRPDPAPAVAVIPARGGSKRIPRKNIKPFLGVPMLARTIAILQAAGTFDRIVVSTDDDEIAAVALAAGAQVPFRRPPALATDHAATIPVIAHAIREMELRGWQYQQICCVYPAAVLSQPSDYREALLISAESKADYVFSATSFAYAVQRGLRRTATGGCEMLWPEYERSRSQDLEPAFHDAGQFYVGQRDAWLQERSFFSKDSRMYLLPRHRVQDIDTIEDWEHAERLFAISGSQTFIEESS